MTICNAAFFHIYNIRRIRKFLNEDNTRTLVNLFVTSRLDYCNSLLYGLPACSLKKLQGVQNTAARLIRNISRFDHITPTPYKLHWLPVKFRIDFKVLLNTYKALQGLVPKYITEIVTIKPKSRYNLRSDSELLLQKPKVKSLSTLGDRSFAFAALHSGTSYPQKYAMQRSLIVLRNFLRHIFLNKGFVNNFICR